MPPTTAPEVIVEDLHKAFDGKPVLAGVDLRVDRGEMVAIVGGSGCGKTVLLKHITGHFRADSGRVLVADHEVPPGADGCPPLRDLAAIDEATFDHIRKHWAVVFQRNALLTGSVLENLAIELREVKSMTEAQIRPLARRALEDVGLDPALVLERDRDQLSGGMAKRVAIARALVMDPVLILYDEPTSGLDPEMCLQIHELIRRTHEGRPAAIADRHDDLRTSIVVTHDTELLRRLRPRVVMLDRGTILFDGPFEEFVSGRHPRIVPYLEQMHVLNSRTA